MISVRISTYQLVMALLVITFGFRSSLVAQVAPWLRDQPTMVGDFYGFGPSQVTLTERTGFAFDTQGFLVSGSAGDPNAVLVFEANGGTADDFFSTGIGTDRSGDGLPDRFAIVEPLPPNEVPTSPGSEYQFDGGEVIYTQGGTTPVDGSFQSGDTWSASYGFSRETVVEIGAGAAGGVATRRLKVGENNSAAPIDRVMFDYRLFNNAVAGLGDVNRYVFGFEKACRCGYSSIDIRMPFASTLDSVQTLGGVASRGIELGNLTATWKQVLWHTNQSVLSAGLGVSLPTADDMTIRLSTGPTVVRIKNEAVHVLPFLAYLRSNGTQTFHAFAQLDVDSNGNPVHGDLSATQLRNVGDLDDATWLFLDVAYINWLYRCDLPNAHGLTGLASFVEFHYSTTLGDVDRVVGNGVAVGNRGSDFDIFNVTFGAHLRYGRRTFLSPAVALPVQSDGDNAFDAEFALVLNRRF